MAEVLTDKEKIDLLMAKYSILRQETIASINNYKSHVKYFQIIVGIIIAFVGVSTEKGGQFTFLNNITFWIFAMFVATTVVSYVALDVVQSIYSMMAINARLTVLEEMINTLANERLLAWESELSSLFHGGFTPAPGLIQPGALLIAYEVLLIIVGLFSIPIFISINFWNLLANDVWVAGYLVEGTLYSLFSMFLLVYSSHGAIIRVREEGPKMIRERIGRKPVQYE